MKKENTHSPKKIIRINEHLVQSQVAEMVRNTVEDTLNAMLEAEANRLTGAEKYERTGARKDTRAGYYQRGLETKAGKVRLNIPRLRKMTFESAIIERYRRRESSVEEALVEMYLAGVSVRRVEDITQALWGTRVSSGTVSNLNKKIYQKIETWRNRPIKEVFPYVYLDGTVLKRSWAGEVKNVSLLVAIGVSEKGYREVLGVAEGAKEDKAGWSNFLRHLKERGLRNTELFITDKCIGLVESIEEFFPQAQWQRCMVHFYRNVWSVLPRGKIREVTAMLKAIHAQEDLEAAQEKAEAITVKLKQMKLFKASSMITESIHETFGYMSFPREHWLRIRTNNPLERIMREIKRRTKVVGCFPDGESAVMLASARLRYIMGTRWSTKRYLNMTLLKEVKKELE